MIIPRIRGWWPRGRRIQTGANIARYISQGLGISHGMTAIGLPILTSLLFRFNPVPSNEDSRLMHGEKSARIMVNSRCMIAARNSRLVLVRHARYEGANCYSNRIQCMWRRKIHRNQVYTTIGQRNEIKINVEGEITGREGRP